jgi:E3 ubiquitin-protein ligase HECTD1
LYFSNQFSFRIPDGFNQVFSLDHVQCFNPQELQLLLCGNQWPSWTLDELLTYIEPSHGFTRERFVD